MKIGQKLILGFIGIALLVGVVGYLAINSGQKVGKSYDKVIDDTVPEILALKKIQMASLRMMMEAMSFVAIEDERKFAAAAAAAAAAGEEEEEFLEAKKEIEKWESEYEKRVEPDDTIELQFVKDIDTAEERIEDLGVEIIALKKKGITGEEIIKKKEELEEAEESFLELIERVIAHEEGELREEREIIHQGFLNSKNIVFGAAGLGFLLAIGLGLFIARSISSPIAKLRDAAVEIGKGKLDTMIKVKSSDEIGELATSFSRMTKDLGVSMQKEKELAAAAAAAAGETKKAEEWQNTFDSILDLICIDDKDFNIIRVNKAFAEAFKSKPEDFIGKKCYEILHKSDKPWPECPFEMTKKDKKPHTQEVDDPNIGFPLLITTSPLFNDKGELTGAVHIAKDISEIRKTENELKKKISDLERFHKVTVGREMEMVNLKKEVNALLEKLGQPKKYEAPEKIKGKT